MLVGVLCLSLFYALLCVHSSFVIETAGCFAIIVLQMYCYYKWSVTLPHGLQYAIVVFPDHALLLFGGGYLNHSPATAS